MFDEDDSEEEDDSEGKKKDDGPWSDPNAKRLLTSCVMNMKHSRYGNLLPIPVLCDENGNKITDEFGQYICLEVDSFGETRVSFHIFIMRIQKGLNRFSIMKLFCVTK